MALSSDLLSVLACPKCKGEVALTEQADGLFCKACSLVYPVEDDIPVMLIEEASEYKPE